MSGDFLKNTFEKSKKCIKLTPSMSPALHLGDFLDVLAHLGVRRAVLLKSLRESDARCIVVPDRGTQVASTRVNPRAGGVGGVAPGYGVLKRALSNEHRLEGYKAGFVRHVLRPEAALCAQRLGMGGVRPLWAGRASSSSVKKTSTNWKKRDGEFLSKTCGIIARPVAVLGQPGRIKRMVSVTDGITFLT
mgnify:CR=1 FL=1|jgi:hypothetical protein